MMLMPRTKYGWTHQKARRVVARLVAGYGVHCARCGVLIVPGEPWDLDHTDDGAAYLGASHRACNRRAGQRRGMLSRVNVGSSRVW